VVTLPARRIVRKLKANLRITAKPEHCLFKTSTIAACRLVKSDCGLLRGAAATWGETASCIGVCLDDGRLNSWLDSGYVKRFRFGLTPV
jgi:hypothetical protein